MSQDFSARRTALLAYAQSCLDAGDYHGCRDACTDLEVIEARIADKADADYWHKRYAASQLDQRKDLSQAGQAVPYKMCPNPMCKQMNAAWATQCGRCDHPL